MNRQFLGFGPVLLLAFTTYRVLPSGLTLTDVGCHPVGMSPSTAGCFPLKLITATLLLPPLVTYAVVSSGERATLFGLLPFGTFFPSPSTPTGALVLTWPTIMLLAVSTITRASRLFAVTKSLLCAWFKVIFSGLPWMGIRVVSVRVPPARLRTSISRSRALEM